MFNYDGTVKSDSVSQLNSGATYLSLSTYDYGTGTGYALGNVLSITSDKYKNGNDGNANDTLTGNSYVWWDGAVQDTIQYTRNTNKPSQIWTTTYRYDDSGHLGSVGIHDGAPRTINYLTDVHGTIYSSEENGGRTTADDPRSFYFRFNGQQIGMVTNNGTDNVGHQMSLADRTRSNGDDDFRFGNEKDIDYADFHGSYTAVNSFRQSSGGGGSYTVQSGDTLQSIAASVWGDASLWYKIAQANGLTGNDQLIAGQSISLPGNVVMGLRASPRSMATPNRCLS